MREIISTNPADGYSELGRVQASSFAEIEQKVLDATAAKRAWKELGVKKRIALLVPVRDAFAKRSEEIAQLVTKEMGKPISASTYEVQSYLNKMQWLFDHVEEAITPVVTHEDDSSLHKIVYEPRGSVAVITPWNFPFGMFVVGAISNLLVGNTVVFKASEECALLGKVIEEIMSDSDVSPGVFSVVHGDGVVGQKLAESAIDFLSFTGSSRVGKLLYALAGEKFIGSLLELGGSNPCIVFADVDVKQAAQCVYEKRFKNCGQSCDAVKRLIVHESIADELIAELVRIVSTKTVGDPFAAETDIGPLVAERQVVLLEKQLADAVSKGATVLVGGKRPENLSGAYFLPTLLTDVTSDMRVWKEEVFGPILSIVPFSSEEEAISLANDTSYGLGGRVMTADADRASRVASRMQCGTVEINYANRWLHCNPFGGYKSSGKGFAGGLVGLRALCQIKVVSQDFLQKV